MRNARLLGLLAVVWAIAGGCVLGDPADDLDVERGRWWRHCGDGTCSSRETADTCPQDCADQAQPDAAVPAVCEPTTCTVQGKDCGTIDDGCGAALECGSCTAPETCGGAGIANVCGESGSTDAGLGTFERPFPLATWLYQPIKADPLLDPDSASMVSVIASASSGSRSCALNDYAVPFYRANAQTQQKTIDCLMNWGTCKLESLGPRPLDASMLPSAGTDGAMVVIDDSPRRDNSLHGRSSDVYWQYDWNGGSPRTSWGDVGDLDGDGLDHKGVGAGVSRAAGIVRAFEIEDGVIDHALVFSTKFCQTTTFRYPATKTDGKYSGTGAIPEGARIQLDPSLNPDDYGLGKGERAVFVALQKYGAYNIDCGGAALAFIFEDIPGNPGAVYTDAGLGWDYYGLTKIPWSKIRVLRSWDGQ